MDSWEYSTVIINSDVVPCRKGRSDKIKRALPDRDMMISSWHGGRESIRADD